MLSQRYSPPNDRGATNSGRNPERNTEKTNSAGRLLDIGCAYGPFLAAAAQAGYQPEGIDLNSDAVAYVQDELGFPARQGDIADATFRATFAPASYDVLSLWYVIEHFPDISKILPWLHRLLKPGGILALSTPNSQGISGRKNLPAFLEDGPADHYSVWNPIQARRTAQLYGFRLARLKSVGHHGERFPGLLGRPPLRRLSDCLSKIFFLGDSMEVYFVKE